MPSQFEPMLLLSIRMFAMPSHNPLPVWHQPIPFRCTTQALFFRGPDGERVRGFDLWGFDERDQRDR